MCKNCSDNYLLFNNINLANFSARKGVYLEKQCVF